MIRNITILITLLLAGTCLSQARTAKETLDLAVRKLTTAPGVSADFTISGPQGKSNGKLKAKGNCFSIVTASAGAWYDGKSMTTWSAQSGEATIVTPTAAELRETNPLLYLHTASDYTANYAKSSNASQKVLVLTPAKRGLTARKITITLNAASLTPSTITILLSDGKTLTVTLRNMSFKSSINANEFRFPKSRYPKAKINDLR